MFERFTERARQVVVYAQEEARTYPSEMITSMHLIGGLLREEEGLGARVLDRLEIKLDHVRANYGARCEEVPTGQVPFTHDAKRAMELALREALSLGHNYIGTEHLLLGLVRDSPAREWLDSQGADAEKVRNEVIRALTGKTARAHERGAAPAKVRIPATVHVPEESPVSAETVVSLIESVARIVGATAALVEPIRVREGGEALAQKALREIADVRVEVNSQADAEALIRAIQMTARDTLEALAA